MNRFAKLGLQFGLVFERLLPGEVGHVLEGDEVVDDSDALVVAWKVFFKDQLAGAPGFARYMLRPIGEIGLDLTKFRKNAKHY